MTLTPCAAGAWSANYGSTAGIFKFRLVNCNTAIEFQLDADTTGWIALGWIANGTTMQHGNGSNIVMTWYAGGTANTQDQYFAGGRNHNNDTADCAGSGGANNVLSATGSETAAPAHTTINFVYPVTTTDGSACDKALIRGNSYNFAIAYRADDTIGSAHANGVHTVHNNILIP